jgi:hypothetical protein
MAKRKVLKFADVSYDQIRSAIAAALQDRYGDNNAMMNCWVRDVFPGYAVYEREGKLWRVNYTVAGADVTVAADSTEVMPEYVPTSDAGDAEMASLTDQWIPIFRAGDYGDKGKYSDDDIAELAATYDPKADEAPIVIGHPKLNAPAFGWVKELKAFTEDTTFAKSLYAKLHQVNPDFEAAVKAGSFKKRSVALFRGEDGKLRLRHVGFLGAMAPEVKGLADATFSGADFQVVEFNQEEVVDQNQQNKFFESLREFFGLKAGEKVVLFTEAQVTEKVNAATKPLQDKLDAHAAAATASAEKAKTFSERATEAVRKLKDAGKWIPAFDKMQLPALFADLAKSETVVTFGEGDKAKQKPALELFADFIGGIKQIVPEGEIYNAAKAAPKAKVMQFNETERIKVDENSVLFNEAAQKRADEKKIDFGVAMKELRAEGWEPAVAGGASGGQV